MPFQEAGLMWPTYIVFIMNINLSEMRNKTGKTEIRNSTSVKKILQPLHQLQNYHGAERNPMNRKIWSAREKIIFTDYSTASEILKFKSMIRRTMRKGDNETLHTIIHKIKEYSLKGFVKTFKKNPGSSVLSTNWKHLIILDDCRYDFFEKEFKRRGLPGSLKKWISLGSWTGEFLSKNFGREYHKDIVFVSANPFTDRYLKGRVYKLISVWKTHWNEKYNTVPPMAVYDVAIEAANKYPEKKLIVHFLQPHHPYFSLKFKDNTMGIIRESIRQNTLKLDTVPHEPLNKLYLSPIYGMFNVKKLVWAYAENLRIVMPYVELLLHKLKGKTVVTSDHGELFGETVTPLLPVKVYGHGIGRNPNLITVPWWIITDADKARLPPIKDIKKEIALVEHKLSLNDPERSKVKEVVRRLKIMRKI